MAEQPSFYIFTFGCRTNQADSAAIRQQFCDSDYLETADAASADVIVINSCTVTHRADQQVRQLTRRLRRDNPAARLIVTGCYAQRHPEELAAIEGVSAVIGNSHKDRIVTLSESVEPADRAEIARVFQDTFDRERQIGAAPAAQVGGRTRPFVKIQDGCDAKCTYCIIPAVRGPSRSVPPDEVLGQVRALVRSGFREIVLTGIHIGTYGMHLQPRCPLDRLLADIIAVEGLGLLRISSIEPMQLSRRVVELAASTDRIAPHFHICLQSGSDRVLKRMLRPYDTARFRALVDEIRDRLPGAAIGTDLIAGFPGETEADHEQSCRFLEEGPFTYCHVFPYSDRSGTEASSWPDKVAEDVVNRRAAQLRAIAQRSNRIFRESFVGWRIRVLTLTRTRSGLREAVSDNYLKVLVEGEIGGNEIVTGQVTRVAGEYLVVAGAGTPDPGRKTPKR